MSSVRPGILSLLTSLLLTACASGDNGGATPAPATDDSTTPPSSAATTVSGFRTPEVGACRGPMTAEIYDAVSDERPTVPCEGPHGSETYFVGRVPDETAELPYGRLSAPPGDVPGLRPIIDQCDQKRDSYVGEKRLDADAVRPHNLGFAFYLPSAADWEQGARWIRCDAVTRPFRGQSERSTTERLQGVGGRDELPDALRWCYREVTLEPNIELIDLGSCEVPHEAEVLVEILVTDPTLDTLADRKALDEYVKGLYFATCRERLAAAIGRSSANFETRTDIKIGQEILDIEDWLTDPTARRVWCLAVMERPVTGTVEGLGTASLPPS